MFSVANLSMKSIVFCDTGYCLKCEGSSNNILFTEANSLKKT